MTAPRARIGDLLVEAGFLTPRDLEAALRTQAEHAKAGRSRKLGQVLLAAGRITATQLTQTLGMQLSVPWASLTHVDFDPALLARVPAELAQLYKLIPVYVRVVKGHGDTLYVAMEDPTNDAALAEVSRHTKLPVRAMIASPIDVQRAIRLHYFGEAPDDDGPTIEVTELEIPLKPRAGPTSAPPPPPPSTRVPAVPQSTITLLDGTSLAVPKRNLPAAGQPPPSQPAKAVSSPPPPLAPSVPPPAASPSHAPPAASAPSQAPPPPSVRAPAAQSVPQKPLSRPPPSHLQRLREGSDADRVVAAAIAILIRKGLLTEAEIEIELL